MGFTTRHLHPVSEAAAAIADQHAEQRGAEVIDKLRGFTLRTKRAAKIDALADAAEHFMDRPHQTVEGHEVAEYLIARAEELS